MSSHLGFLSDICENPGDVGLRLVFADWLEDSGDVDRAEFVRLQIQLDEMPAYSPERFDLEERALDLLAEHRTKWLGKQSAWLRGEQITFRCGLPGEMRLPPGRFLAQGDKLTRSYPLIRLTLEGLHDRAAEMANMPAMARLPELELPASASSLRLRDFLRAFNGGRLRHFGLAGTVKVTKDMLAGWPGLRKLTSLSLRGHRYNDEVLAALVGSPEMGELRQLVLSNCYAGPRTVAALAESDRLKGLQSLELIGKPLGNAAVRSLARADWRLEELRLNTAADESSLLALMGAPWFAGLRSLHIDAQQPSPIGPLLLTVPTGILDLKVSAELTHADRNALLASDLAIGLSSLDLCCHDQPVTSDLTNSPRLNRLAYLRLHDAEINSDSAWELLESEHLSSIRELHLNGCHTSDNDHRASTATLSQLRALSLTGYVVRRELLRDLVRSSRLGNLKRLDLSWNTLDHHTMLALLEAPWLPSLRELRLAGTALSDAFLRALAKCEGVARLRVLDLGEQWATSNGAEALANSPHLGQLLYLRLSVHGTEQSRVVREILRERFGGIYDG